MGNNHRWPVRTVVDRFWSHVRFTDGCWEWTAFCNRGYGQFNISLGHPMLAHRFAWCLATTEPIPQGMHVCHHCDNPSCVRSDHLFLGTDADNLKDMARKGRGANQNTYRTHCRKGHELAGANLRYNNKGQRVCWTCARDNWQRYRARKRFIAASKVEAQ